jgi:hypothetical protein
MAMGLLLVILMRPPITWRRGRWLPVQPELQLSYFLPTLTALVSGVLFVLATIIPLAQRLLYITPLKSTFDYLLVLEASLAWAAVFGGYLLLSSGVRRAVGPKG